MLFLFPLAVFGAVRGVGVRPASIEASFFPYTEQLFVQNLSAEKEWIEITIDKHADLFSLEPGRFSLEPGAVARVLVTFEEPEQSTSGNILVAATRVSPQGLETGTGMKIPFRLRKNVPSEYVFVASLEGIFSSGAAKVVGGIALLLFLLGALSTGLAVLLFQGREPRV